MAYCYILYSQYLGRFYTGFTQDLPEKRLSKHLAKLYGADSFSVKADDWKIYYVIECKSKRQALKIEQHIKKMKSSTYIENLKLYPEMTQKLLIRFED